MTPDPHGDHDRNGEHDPRHSWPLPGEHSPREMFSTRLIVGVVIMLLGVTLLADNLGWIEAKHVFRAMWPLALVAVGVAMVRRPQHRRSREGGWVLITIGIWLFLKKIGWVDFSLGQFLVPAIFLFVGGMLVFRSLKGPGEVPKATLNAPNGDAAPGDHAEFVRSFAMLSGVELRPVSRPFRGADLSAVMGGIKLDLSSARMEGDSAVIELFAFWGGVEIYVPPEWTVTSEVTTLLAGFIDKRRPTSIVPTRRLVIKGTAVMSGVELKN